VARLQLREGHDRRLQARFDKQDGGTALTADEQADYKVEIIHSRQVFRFL